MHLPCHLFELGWLTKPVFSSISNTIKNWNMGQLIKGTTFHRSVSRGNLIYVNQAGDDLKITPRHGSKDFVACETELICRNAFDVYHFKKT